MHFKNNVKNSDNFLCFDGFKTTAFITVSGDMYLFFSFLCCSPLKQAKIMYQVRHQRKPEIVFTS